MFNIAHANRIALVTGATHGIGYEVGRQLADAGTAVILHARTREDGYRAVARLVRNGTDPRLLKVAVADFTRLEDVRALADRVITRHRRIDLLINNAAIVGGARRSVTGDGHEQTFQVNYLAHYLLTRLLWQPLSAAPRGRVVNLSSVLHRIGHLHWTDLDKTDRYVPSGAYAQSKLALTMLTQALATHSLTAVTAVSVHPGVIATGTMRGVYGRYGAPVVDGARAVLHLCEPHTEVRNGGYYEGKMPAAPGAPVQDPGSVDRLWRLSARLTGLDQTNLTHTTR